MSAPRVDTWIRLSDQRRLAYAEYGDPAGHPVFVFHGLPGSRLSWGLLPDGSLPASARIVAPDRPGYGGSDPNPGRTLLDWVRDVAQLADALQINRFAVVGVSGGGPGALACASVMPQRLTRVGVAVSPAPTDAPGALDGMSGVNRFFMKVAWYLPWLSSANARLLARLIRRDPRRYINTMKRKMDPVDIAVIDRPEIQHMLVSDFAEAVRNGATGIIDDLAANHGRPWGFSLEQIRSEVLLWSCELDRSVPPGAGTYLSTAIPSCRVKLVRDAGHLWVLLHLHDIIAAVLDGEFRR